MLREFLTAHRSAIVTRAHALIAARRMKGGERGELALGIPVFLERLLDTLSLHVGFSGANEAFQRGAAEHGAHLAQLGLAVAEVVQDYGDVSKAIADLAEDMPPGVTGRDLRDLDRCLQHAVALAVTAHARGREASIEDDARERLGEFAHELRNCVGSAMISFDLLKTGTAGMGGSTAGVLGRSLTRLSALVSAAVADVRLESRILVKERVSVHDFIEEAEASASIDPSCRDVTLAVVPVERGIDVEVDRQLLAAALANLVDNAFKFSRAKGRVRLRASATRERVFIDVEDECGGLPGGKLENPFRSFQQSSANRSGLGLGLSLSRKSVEANGGSITVRDLPGAGCVFTIDLPRLSH